jgi:hypothetical protein
MGAPLCDDPGPLSFTIQCGSTFTRRWTPSGTPWDLTGFTAEAQARLAHPDAEPIINLSTADGTITLGDDEGWFQFDISADLSNGYDTAVGYKLTRLVWDLELIDGDGDPTRVAEGIITLKPNATRTEVVVEP